MRRQPGFLRKVDSRTNGFLDMFFALAPCWSTSRGRISHSCAGGQILVKVSDDGLGLEVHVNEFR